jgi:hypothetical protein
MLYTTVLHLLGAHMIGIVAGAAAITLQVSMALMTATLSWLFHLAEITDMSKLITTCIAVTYESDWNDDDNEYGMKWYPECYGSTGCCPIDPVDFSESYWIIPNTINESEYT